MKGLMYGGDSFQFLQNAWTCNSGQASQSIKVSSVRNAQVKLLEEEPVAVHTTRVACLMLSQLGHSLRALISLSVSYHSPLRINAASR